VISNSHERPSTGTSSLLRPLKARPSWAEAADPIPLIVDQRVDGSSAGEHRDALARSVPHEGMGTGTVAAGDG
jgi:hypothetical protein